MARVEHRSRWCIICYMGLVGAEMRGTLDSNNSSNNKQWRRHGGNLGQISGLIYGSLLSPSSLMQRQKEGEEKVFFAKEAIL